MIRLISALVFLVAADVSACSLVSCIDQGVEMRRDFVIVIKHEGKPLRGVSVKVTASYSNMAITEFSAVTASDGTVHVTGLAVGEYWLDAKFLGFSAAYHCFHVAERQSRKAKRTVSYKWGDFATNVNKVAGTLVDTQPATSGAPLWSLIHPADVPIRGAELMLQNPVTGSTYKTTSNQEGVFAFGAVPDATYVLHIAGGDGGRAYDPADLLVKIGSAAIGRDSLDLRRVEGGCGGVTLNLR